MHDMVVRVGTITYIVHHVKHIIYFDLDAMFHNLVDEVMPTLTYQSEQKHCTGETSERYAMLLHPLVQLCPIVLFIAEKSG